MAISNQGPQPIRSGIGKRWATRQDLFPRCHFEPVYEKPTYRDLSPEMTNKARRITLTPSAVPSLVARGFRDRNRLARRCTRCVTLLEMRRYAGLAVARHSRLTKRSPPPLPPLFLAVPAVLAYAAVVPALSRPPETRYLLIPRRKSSDADKESTQTARRQLPLSSDLFLWPKNPGAPTWPGGCARKRPHRNLPTWGRESSLSPAARLVLFAEEAWVVHARAVGRRVERVLHLGWVE